MRSAQRLAHMRVVVGAVASSPGAVTVTQLARRRCLRRGADAPGAGSGLPPSSRRRDARPPLFCSVGSLLGASAVLSGRRSLSAVICGVASSPDAVAVARRSRRRCLRAGTGTHGADSVVPPRSRRRNALTPLFHSGGSLLGACAEFSGRRSLSAIVCAVASSLEAVELPPCAAATVADAAACRRARGGVAIGHRSFAAAARFTARP